MELVLKMGYSAGFAIETNYFVSLLENFDGANPSPFPEVMSHGTGVFQIQSRNPHFHGFVKGDDHLNEMIEGQLSVIYHSAVCPQSLRKQILEELFRQKVLRK